MMRCRWAICGRRISIFKDTPFLSSKLCIFTKIKIIQYWLISIDLRGMVELLGVSRQTISSNLQRVCVHSIKNIMTKINPIGGPAVIVKIDGSKMEPVNIIRIITSKVFGYLGW
ncbi:hypothetical protein DMUE_2626 [Dictyocoela muelleri]|nr:hypothetical protein DMUE_2626 [Dictyocoela muelleri]